MHIKLYIFPAYRCANKLEPLKKGEKIRTCKLDPYQNGKQEDTEDTGSVKPNQSKLYNNEFANGDLISQKFGFFPRF